MASIVSEVTPSASCRLICQDSCSSRPMSPRSPSGSARSAAAAALLADPLGDLGDIGRLLHESWQIKRQLAEGVTSDTIDAIYDAARDAGAQGGKLLGAGGGGFLLLFVEPE